MSLFGEYHHMKTMLLQENSVVIISLSQVSHVVITRKQAQKKKAR